MWTRQELKTNAKLNFKRNYWPCVGVAFLMALFGGGITAGNGASRTADSGSVDGSYAGGISEWQMMLLVVMAIIAVLAIVLSIFVGNVLRVGGYQFFIANRTEMPSVGQMFGSFRGGNYGNIVLTMFLKDLYVMLWTLLLIIPGIIKSYEYLMVPYILAENPAMNQKEAFAISKRMMDGEKMNAFILELSFFGWYFVGVLTCGLAIIFYVQPYFEATMTEFYAYNKGKAYNEGYIR